ncbi:MAG: adenylate/guanylate cyclase domain-containing protein [Alphaproteobacteria bacterium]|nr:adenylate/guanylate cyclase domain-containing protein [Alphaproteobacteria bacterium]
MPGLAIPTDRHGRIWLRYGLPAPERTISAGDVLAGRVGTDRLQGRIALLGLSAAGLADVRATPILDGMTGIAVQAQVLETILAGEWLVRPDFAGALEATLIAALGLVLALTIPLLGPWWSLVLALVAVASTVAGSWFSYTRMGLLIDIAYPALATAVLYTLLTALSLLREQAARRQMRTVFAHYLAPELVEQLAREPERLRIGGETREMTVMFTDLRGFTSISEEFISEPEALTRLLNRYFTAMTDRILEARGTIGKYMGDGIMAFWNAPLPDPDHARHACAAALELLDGARKLNAKLQADALADGSRYVPAEIGVGLNTGICIVGNLGSEHRISYSAIGDPVNLAARIEAQSRLYDVPIVIGEATRAQAPEFATLELDLIRVKGKGEPSRIYTLFGDARTAGHESFNRLASAHAAMLAAYRDQDWIGARRQLAAARACDGRLANLYALYAARIDAFERAPPGPNWDGVYVAETK